MLKLAQPHRVGWIAGSAAVSGVTTYVLLAAAAAGLGPSGFDEFSLYWAVLVVFSVGAFLPLEQIVSRHAAKPATVEHLQGWTTRWGGAAVVVGCLSLVWVSQVADGKDPVPTLLVAVFGLNLLATVLQAVLRGLAAGRLQLDVYAAIVVMDSILRAFLCAALAVCGVDQIEAYALAVALGSVAGVLVGWLLLRRRPAVTVESENGASPAVLSREARSLVPAMLAMQLLLNSPIFVAFAYAEHGVSAGRVLAIASLVRASIFVAQAAQAAYVGRIAALVHERSPEVARTVRAVLGLVLALAAVTVLGGTILGPTAVELLYGVELAVDAELCFFVSAGTAVFLVAIVVNDLAVARGLHRHAGLYWVLGVLAAAVSAVVLPTGDARIFVPIMVGSGVALLLTVVGSRQIDRSLSD